MNNSGVVSRTNDKDGGTLYTKRHLEELVKLQTSVLRQQARELQRMNERILETMSNVVEFRNLESGDHVKRVKDFTRILAVHLAKVCPEYELDKVAVDVITAAAALHDVGKIAIPDAILLKPGRLTAQEFEVMKTHTTKGCEIIAMLGDIQEGEYGRVSYEICRYHHERYDGGGYPEGLGGEDRLSGGRLRRAGQRALLQERVHDRGGVRYDYARRLRSVFSQAPRLPAGSQRRA